jgi:hypothetical protein
MYVLSIFKGSLSVGFDHMRLCGVVKESTILFTFYGGRRLLLTSTRSEATSGFLSLPIRKNV